MNKKGLSFKNMFFAIIVVGMITVAASSMIVSWDNKYNSGLVPDLGDYDNIDEVYDQSQTQSGRITPDDPDPGTDAEGSGTFTGAFGIISNLQDSFLLITGKEGMVKAAADTANIPNWARRGVITMIVIAITLAIVSIVFRIPGGKV